MSTPTTNLKLPKPDLNEEGWGDIANAVFDALDAAPRWARSPRRRGRPP